MMLANSILSFLGHVGIAQVDSDMPKPESIWVPFPIGTRVAFMTVQSLKRKRKNESLFYKKRMGRKRERKLEREKEEAECNALTPQDIILSALGPFHLHSFKTRHAC